MCRKLQKQGRDNRTQEDYPNMKRRWKRTRCPPAAYTADIG